MIKSIIRILGKILVYLIRTLLLFRKKDNLAIDKSEVNSILIIFLINGIGDAVMFLPTLKSIRKFFKSAKIYLITERDETCSILSPYADECFKIDLLNINFKNIISLIKLLRMIREKKIDLSICTYLEGSFYFSLLSLISGARYRIGYKERNEGVFYTHIIDGNNKEHQVENNLKILDLLGIDRKNIDISCYIDDNAIQFVNNFFEVNNLTDKDFIIAIHTGNNQSSSAMLKKWDDVKFADLIKQLRLKYNAKIILVGSKSEADSAQKISNLVDFPIINAVGKTSLIELSALISRCNIFIGTDGGPMHISSAMNIPVVAIFGPTNPSLVGPYSFGAKNVIIEKDYPCKYCYEYYRKKNCNDNICLKNISAEDVMRGVEEVMGNW